MSQSASSYRLSPIPKQRLLSTQTQYHSAPTSDDPEDGTQLRNVLPARQPSSRSLRNILSIQLLCLAWVVPVICLLVLNFREYIIGASAWCPWRKCWVDAFNLDHSVPPADLARLAVQDHDLNNALLYVAKLLEIWFGVSAASFMYLLIMLAAGSSMAIPIRLLMLPSEFPNLLSVLDASLWASVFRAKGHGHGHVWKLLVLVAVFMGLLSNLMGPATGTLVLPTLKWVDTPTIFQGYLVPGIAAPIYSAEIPSTSGFAFGDSGCSVDNFEAGRWSCSTKWSHLLDSWVSSAFAALSGNDIWMNRAISAQGALSLNMNMSTDDWLWVPSRQSLQELDNDRTNVVGIANGSNYTQLGITEEEYHQYAAYNSSLKVVLQRSGPIVGTRPRIHFLDWSKRYHIEVDQNRSILCVTNYTLYNPVLDDDFTTKFTKCFQTATPGGHGWPEDSLDRHSRGQRTVRKRDSFTVDAPSELSDGTYDASVNVTVFGSGAAVMLPNGSMQATDEQTSLPELCLNATTPSGLTCNWTHLFSSEYNRYSLSDETADVSAIEFSQNSSSNETIGIFIDYVAWVGRTVYELDPWPTTNTLGLVQTPTFSLGYVYSRLPIDPSWILAAWTVDQENGHVPSNRTVAQMLHSEFYHLRTNENIHGYDEQDDIFAFIGLTYLPLAQALSLIEWNSNGTQPDPQYEIEGLSRFTKLESGGKVYVWAYGFDSKTARLGAAVAITGCIVTCLQFVFALVQPRKPRSLTQVVLAALAHEPRDDFVDVGDKLGEQARARFSVRDAESRIGGLTFKRVR